MAERDDCSGVVLVDFRHEFVQDTSDGDGGGGRQGFLALKLPMPAAVLHLHQRACTILYSLLF